MTKKKTGLYFGTFNPIHIGHCVIAQHMLEFTDLDEVWFVVTPHNPHKKKNTLLDDYQRLHMVQLAVDDQYQMQVSNMEFDLPQPSYTATTLAHAAEKYPDRDFALIMGADNLQTFHKWRNYEWILEHHKLYVYPRIESDGGDLKSHPNVSITEAPIMQIASTDIREAIKAGKNVSFMLPEKVWKFIDEGLFYK
jgi:nicotinate-nucleotide adenylyltransferase